MHVFFGIAYLIIGIVQLFAIVDGIGYALGIEKFFSFVIAFIITYIPILGSVAGVYGAINVWDWSLLQAAALFFWYIPVALAMFAVGAIVDR